MAFYDALTKPQAIKDFYEKIINFSKGSVVYDRDFSEVMMAAEMPTKYGENIE